MPALRYIGSRALFGVLLLLGVTLISFILMVQFGPDRSFEMAGKNPTPEQLEEVRKELGYDQPFISRYVSFLGDLVSGDMGLSDANGEDVARLLGRTTPVTLALVLPGFLLGNVLGLVLGMLAAWRRGSALDRLIMGSSVVGMSLSFLVIIIGLQVLLCTPYGFNWFPVRGWNVTGLGSWFTYATVPSLALILVTLGYNTRFYRAVVAEELNRDHVRTLLAYGANPLVVMFRHVLKNSMVPIITRVLFSIPLVVVSGSLLLESHFGIPGVGRATYAAITSGDQPVLLAVVSLTAVGFVAVQLASDLLIRAIDPRVGES